jgi:two-component system, LytTR family, sensor histidine kinase AlgZ
MRSILKKIKKFLFKVEHRVPYIPDFSSVLTILKVIYISLTISIVYTFTQINKASDFYWSFWKSLQIFSPYVLTLLFLLMLFAKMINKTPPFKAILFIIMLSIISVYFIDSIMIQTYFDLIANFDDIGHKFGTAIGLMFFFLVYFDWREKSLHPSQIVAQLSFLQSKMRPHFLFNTLNSIVVLIKKEPELAKKMLLNLSILLRASLKDNKDFMYTIKEEINLCEKYLEIEKIRMGERLGVVWDIDEQLLKYSIPKLSIQPLVENSILHGVQHLESGGTITIQIKNKIEDKININISNPKSPSVDKNEENHNNIGLKNLIERLNICFEGEVSFKSKEDSNLYNVDIVIPKKEQRKN